MSVFSEDKKTDLIGEAWINLQDGVVLPGGGRKDAWHNLTYKGKYAGQIRIEMSYYDSRVPEKPVIPKQPTSINRKSIAGPSPTIIPQFGPRNMGFARGSTVYVNGDGTPAAEPISEQHVADGEALSNASPLPERRSLRNSMSNAQSTSYTGSLRHSQSQLALQHFQTTHSTNDTYMEPARSMSSDRSRVQNESWQGSDYGYDDHNAGNDWGMSARHQDSQSWQDDDTFDAADLPPLPPSHGNTPVRAGFDNFDRESLISASPLQLNDRKANEQGYSSNLPATALTGSRPLSEYRTPPRSFAGPSPLRREIPAPLRVGQHSPTSPFSRSTGSTPSSVYVPELGGHAGIGHHSVSDTYIDMHQSDYDPVHPLSQEVRRSASPQPYHGTQGYIEPQEFHFPTDVPLVRPQPVSHAPRTRHSIAAIRHPTSVNSHLSHRPGLSEGGSSDTALLTRKSVPTVASPDMFRANGPFSAGFFESNNSVAKTPPSQAQHNPTRQYMPYRSPPEPRRGLATRHSISVLQNSSNTSSQSFDFRHERQDNAHQHEYDAYDESSQFSPRFNQPNTFGNTTDMSDHASPAYSYDRNIDSRRNTMQIDTSSHYNHDYDTPIDSAYPEDQSPLRNRLMKRTTPSRSSLSYSHPTAVNTPLREISAPNIGRAESYDESFTHRNPSIFSNEGDNTSSPRSGSIIGNSSSADQRPERKPLVKRASVNFSRGAGGFAFSATASPTTTPLNTSAPASPLVTGGRYGYSRDGRDSLSEELAKIDIGSGNGQNGVKNAGKIGVTMTVNSKMKDDGGVKKSRWSFARLGSGSGSGLGL